jgi:hypothetical protein
MEIPRPRVLRSAAVLLGVLLVLTDLVDARRAADVSDAAFWHMVSEFSEAGGSFPAQNFVSNELAFQTVLPALKRTIKTGGVYLGVGPDQNFTYIAALRPRLSFIVDIRRQNMLQHLLYKAIIEMSPGRAEFLARLFSRPGTATLGPGATAQSLLAQYWPPRPGDEEIFAKNLREVLDRLKVRHKFALSPDDEETIAFVYRAFFDYGPALTYSPGSVPTYSGVDIPSSGRFPTYADLMTTTDGRNVNQSYLGTETNYRALRDLELQNRIIPIVGNFSGPKALSAVGAYLKEQDAVVTAFYTSNVEQYLFQDDGWRRYYRNVAALPLDRSSTFIRAYFPGGGIGTPVQSSTLLCSIQELLDAVNANRIHTYLDVIDFSK